MELKALSPVLLTGALSKRVKGEFYLKGETLKELLKETFIYHSLKGDKELFDEFYKKLVEWKSFEFETEQEEKRELANIGLWLEKKVLCGGEPEIVNGKVVNYEEEKNLLNLFKISDFSLQGEVKKLKVKLVGRIKRFVGVRFTALEGSTFSGEFEIEGLEEYERHAQKPFIYPQIKEGKVGQLLTKFALKVLETDKELFADFGYSSAVKYLEEIEAQTLDQNLFRVNYKGGILPYGAELFCYELVETGKGRKEYHHLSEIFTYLTQKGLSGEIFSQTRELVAGKPIGWLLQI